VKRKGKKFRERKNEPCHRRRRSDGCGNVDTVVARRRVVSQPSMLDAHACVYVDIERRMYEYLPTLDIGPRLHLLSPSHVNVA